MDILKYLKEQFAPSARQQLGGFVRGAQNFLNTPQRMGTQFGQQLQRPRNVQNPRPLVRPLNQPRQSAQNKRPLVQLNQPQRQALNLMVNPVPRIEAARDFVVAPAIRGGLTGIEEATKPGIGMLTGKNRGLISLAFNRPENSQVLVNPDINPALKGIMGNEPMYSLKGASRETTKTAQQAGVPKPIAKTLGPLGAVVGLGMDMTIGGGKDDIAKAIAKSSNLRNITTLANKAGITDPKVLKRLVKETDAKKIGGILDSAKKSVGKVDVPKFKNLNELEQWTNTRKNQIPNYWQSNEWKQISKEYGPKFATPSTTKVPPTLGATADLLQAQRTSQPTIGAKTSNIGKQNIQLPQGQQIKPTVKGTKNIVQPTTLPQQTLSPAKGTKTLLPESTIAPQTVSLKGSPRPDYTTLEGSKQLQNAKITGNKVKNALDEIKNTFSPGKNTKQVQVDLRAQRGQFDLQRDFAVVQSKAQIHEWNRLKPQDHLNFIQAVETGAKQPTKPLQQLADRYRNIFNQDYALAQSLKEDLPYRKNYFSQSGIWANPKEAEAFYNKWATPSLGGKPGALEQRTFPTILDGIKAGLKVKETNPEVIALNNRTSLMKLKMAQDFKTEQIAKGSDPLAVQKTIDRYLEPGLKGNALFQTTRQANASLNSLQLGLSGFHVSGTAINATVSKEAMAINDLLTGHPLTAMKHVAQAPTASLEYIFRGNKMLKDFKAGNLNNPDIQNVVKGGGRLQMPMEYRGVGFDKAWQDMKNPALLTKLKGIGETVPAAIEAVAKPVMQWWVPRLKDGAAADLIANNLKRLPKNATPEQINAVRAEAINSIDNRFGQLVQDNLFWSKTLKDLMGLGMRSPGWNIGTVRELGGGTADIFTKSGMKNLFTGKGISDRSAYTVALPLTVGTMGAVYQYLKTGKGPQQIEDFFYPQTGQLDPKTGNPERVSFPTYMKDVYSVMKDPIATAIHKQSPIINEVTSLYKNEDFYGRQIRDPYANPLEQGKQVLSYLGNVNMPFSITSGNRRVEQNAQARAESFMGLVPAPGSIQNPGKGEAYLASQQIENIKQEIGMVESNVKYGKMTPEEGQRQIEQLNKRITNAISAQQKAQDKQMSGVQNPVEAASPGTSKKYQPQLQSNDIKELPDGSVQYKLNGKWKFTDNRENAEENIVKAQVEGDQQRRTLGNKIVYYDKSTGKAKIIDKSTLESKIQNYRYQAQKESLKNSGNVKGYYELQVNQINNLEKQKADLDPVAEMDQIMALEKQQQAIAKDISKLEAYGGFKKPKKGGGKAKKGKKLTVKDTSSGILKTLKTPKKQVSLIQGGSGGKSTSTRQSNRAIGNRSLYGA